MWSRKRPVKRAGLAKILHRATSFVAEPLEGRVFLSGNYTITDLGSLGAPYNFSSAAAGINASGQVAGTSSSSGNASHAFIYSGGALTDLGTLGGANSTASGINVNGMIAGYADNSSQSLRAFLYSSGTLTNLGTLSAPYNDSSLAYGINNSGAVVGESDTSGGDSHAFLYSNGSLTDLGTLGGADSSAFAINGPGQIVGYALTSGGAEHAFLYSGGVMTDLGTLAAPYNAASFATGINNSGQIVGESDASDGSAHAFLYSNGTMIDLGTLGGNYSSASGINGAGQVVGNSFTSSGDDDGFLYANGVMTDLNSLLPAGSGWILNGAAGINANGQIVGVGFNPSGMADAFLLTPPASSSAPDITSGSTATFTAGTAGTFAVTSTGTPNSALSESGALPSGVTFVDNGNGSATLSGTPAGGTGGNYVLNITAANGNSPNATQTFTLTVDQAPAITSSASTTFTTGTAGSFTITSTGFPTASLTESGTLPGGVTFADNHNGTATLSGTPAGGTGGNYVVTINVSNGVTPNAPQAFTLIVHQPPTITNASSTTFTAGSAGSFTVTTTGFPADALSETGTLPSGVTFTDNHNGTATLTGTAAAGTGGTFPITINASNGISPNASQAFTLTVDQSPAITSSNAATFTTGTAGSFSVSTTGFPTDTLTETGTLPSGVTFADNHNGTATLSGTAAGGTGGSYVVTINATNGVTPNAPQTFTLTVHQPPAITNSASTTFTVGSTGSFTVTSTGSPTDTLSETGALPSGVTFTDNHNGTATLTGTPAGGSGGTYPITITAANGVSPNASQGFTLTVNQSLAITSSSTSTFTTGTAGSLTVTTSGFPNPSLSEGGTLPSGVTFVDNHNGTATLGGTPAAATGGNYIFTITAVNGVSANATQAFTLTVHQPPAITNANNTTFIAGTVGTFTITGTGFPTDALSETGTLPSGVTFTDNRNGTGSLHGTPAAGTGGTYVVTLGASNGVGSAASQTFTLTVDQSPAITSANNATFTAGAAGSFSVTSTGVPTDTLSETGALPGGVTFIDNHNGMATLSGTPSGAAGGNYVITINAANGVSPAGTQAFTLTVNQAPAITSSSAAIFTTGTAGSFTITSSGNPTNALSETGALPSGVTFVDNHNGTATLAGTPSAGAEGNYVLALAAHNGTGSNATQNFTLTIDQPPAITSSANATFVATTSGSFTVTTTGFPNAALTETGALPSGVTFVDNGNGTATLSGVAGASAGGTYVLMLHAANGVSTAVSKTFTLTVDQASAISSSNATTFFTGTAGTFTVTTNGFPTYALSETGALPGGVTFVDNGNGTATLGGTPAAGSGGNYLLTITASNGSSPNATENFTLSVDQPPAITNSNAATFTAGAAGSFSVTTTGFPNDILSETGTLPSGVTFVDNANNTGSLSGTPAAETGGVYVLTLNAKNGVSPNAAQTFMLTVDQVPAITSANAATFVAGTAGTFTVTGSGFPKDAFSETGTLPSGVAFADNGNGTGSLSGNPAVGSAGTYVLTLHASNGTSPNATQTFTLTVDQAPAITSVKNATCIVGTAGSFTVTSTGFPTDHLTEQGALPGGVTFIDNGNGIASLSGTATSSASGNYVFTLSAANGVSPNATQAFTLTVDQAPAISSSNAATFTVGAAGSFTVNSSGFPVDALSEVGALPAGVTFVDNGNGTATLSGTPAVAQGMGGTYVLSLKAQNGVSPSASQNFTLTIDQAPAITSLSNATFTAGTSGSFTITSSGFPNVALRESGDLPNGVTFVDNGDGTATLSGVPASGAGGTYILSLTGQNGASSQAGQNFRLTVDEAPTITSANNATFSIGAPGSFTVQTTGFPNSALSENGPLPGGLMFVDNGDGTATLSGTPSDGTDGNYILTLNATNGTSRDAGQTFTLTINEASAITSANNTTFTTKASGSFTITSAGSPTNALSETGALPDGVTFVDNGDGTATLSGRPDSDMGGSYLITLDASNGVSADATQTFMLNVDEPPAISSDDNATFTTGKTGSFTITTTGFPAAALSKSGVLPSGVSFVDNHDGTATLSGTPADGTGGIYVLMLKGKNGLTPNARQTFTLTINQPTAMTNADTTTFTIGNAGNFTVLTTGFPIASMTESGNLPVGMRFVDKGNGKAKIRGTPEQGTAGAYNIMIKGTNGVKPKAKQSFTLFVANLAAPSNVLRPNATPANRIAQAAAYVAPAADAIILSGTGDDTLFGGELFGS